MVSPELLNTLKSRDQPNKFYIAQVLISELAQQETDLIKAGQPYPVWSPYDSFAAANTMLEILQSTTSLRGKPMPQTTVLENINQLLEKLPESIQIQILHYLENINTQHFQETPNNHSETPEEIKPKKRDGFGIWKGKISMADNFDEPLEDMQDYM